MAAAMIRAAPFALLLLVGAAPAGAQREPVLVPDVSNRAIEIKI